MSTFSHTMTALDQALEACQQLKQERNAALVREARLRWRVYVLAGLAAAGWLNFAIALWSFWWFR